MDLLGTSGCATHMLRRAMHCDQPRMCYGTESAGYGAMAPLGEGFAAVPAVIFHSRACHICVLLLPQCTTISREDGRWRATSCKRDLPTACRLERPDGTEPLWIVEEGAKGECPHNYAHRVPAHARDNYNLQQELVANAVEEAWLPMTGKAWHCPDRQVVYI